MIGALLSGPCAAQGPALKPYQADAWTLHLWHLDEPTAPFLDEAPKGTPLLGLLNNAQAGIPSLRELGSSVSFNHDAGGRRGGGSYKGGILLAAPELDLGDRDNVSRDFKFAGEDGAFTFEAIVRFEVLPERTGTAALCVISMENERGPRVFNFRVDRSGFLSFIRLDNQGAGSGALAAIPSSGPHAINTTDWFHVAVTYNGLEGTSNNICLYWTRLDARPPAAHLIGKGTLLEDLRNSPADFAIGNEARSQGGVGEAEPFAGMIDEVRISSVARDPTDFIIVPPEQRIAPDQLSATTSRFPLEVQLSGMLVDGRSLALGSAPSVPELPPGPHRLDFDFGIPSEHPRPPSRIRYRLKGVDDRWSDIGLGMGVTCEILDDEGKDISLMQFPILGTSRDWQTNLDDSTFTPRIEPFLVPKEARALRITISSGAADTTGSLAIDDLSLVVPDGTGGVTELWTNGDIEKGHRLHLPSGIPEGWERSGSAPNIARMVSLEKNRALALIDGDQSASGSWSCTHVLPAIPPEGSTMQLRWSEMYSVIGGSMHRATFLNVPPGRYTFEAVAATLDAVPDGAQLSKSFLIRSPLTSRPWFWAVISTVVVGFAALGIVADLRRRAARKVGALRVQNALAQDRARIARDMHDDLGTRITRLTMNAALAQRDLEKNPDSTRRHLGNLSSSARDLVTAMDGLVWAVDPANDGLDQFAERLARLAEEIFQDSQVRCTIDIPHVLPDRPLISEARHHLYLSVKEALHNILQHAGPCDASFSLAIHDDRLEVVITDTGRGFEINSAGGGNGLGNLSHRLASLGGRCTVTSNPGKGTRVRIACPLASLVRSA